jgi:xanthine dehydrogenase YagR molybdenum-binding subunit
MGPGTPTAMTKIAASVLQMSTQKIKFKLGDSDLPPGPTQGGSGTTSSLGSAVDLICNNIIKELKKLAIQFAPSFKAISEDAIEIKNDLVQSKTGIEKISTQELFQLANKSNIDLTVTSTGNGAQPLKYATNSFSAHFVKVLVHPQKGTIDIKHIVSTGDAGKIISENTARSQMLGGVVGGIGMAMLEQVEWDHTSGQIINASFGGYQVPRHKNIPITDVWFVNKPDPYINSIGAKGLGEIAFIGLAAAISSALFNATGKRVRDLPITPQKLGFKAIS